MKNYLLLLLVVLCSVNINAQKIINNPDYISTNINGNVTKIELTDTETILHFYVKSSIGSWIAIPRETYIENSLGKGERVYITKTEGITLTGKNYMENSDEIRYKLYFPAIDKDIVSINYGESNKGGNWYIYKLDLSKDGKAFLNSNKLKDWLVEVRESANDSKGLTFKNNIFGLQSNNSNVVSNNTLLPTDLPAEFFGNWYDKYGTLILATTPDYIVSNYRVQHYRDIQKIGDNKFSIKTNMRPFQVLDVDSERMTIRTDRLITLTRKPSLSKVPKFIKGDWLHWLNIKEINVTDDYFYNSDHGVLGLYESTRRIDQIIESDSGNIIWFVLYREGNYDLYSVRKIEGEYVLHATGYAKAKYKKVKN